EPAAGGEDPQGGLEPEPEPGERNVRPGMMLQGVLDSARREVRQRGRAGCRRAAFVDCDCTGLEPDLAPAPPQPATEIDVLAVQEEILVPAAELLERRASHHEARARDPFGGSRLLVLPLVPHDLVRPRGARRGAMEEDGA